MLQYNSRMQKILPILICLCFVAPAGAAKRVVVTSLPEPVRAFAETETNVAFSVGAVTNSTWKLSVELDASASNCVEVVLGTDADDDGALGVAEGDLSVGGIFVSTLVSLYFIPALCACLRMRRTNEQ